ncbi:MAG: hypothetical protein FWD62_15990 [Betaproteobacteria bacterium]|nr:hypothetical protein [Betaproteobacteria bacterium]
MAPDQFDQRLFALQALNLWFEGAGSTGFFLNPVKNNIDSYQRCFISSQRADANPFQDRPLNVYEVKMQASLLVMQGDSLRKALGARLKGRMASAVAPVDAAG